MGRWNRSAVVQWTKEKSPTEVTTGERERRCENKREREDLLIGMYDLSVFL